MVHTIIALVRDHPGVLHRMVSLFRRRGYNIASLTVGPCGIPDVSRLTLVVDADVAQVVKQLNRLIEVLNVQDVTQDTTVDRETLLIKVHATAATRAPLIALATAHRARIVDIGTASAVLELTDTPEAIERFVGLVRPIGITEMIRTGRITMLRGTALTIRTDRSWAAQADGVGY